MNDSTYSNMPRLNNVFLDTSHAESSLQHDTQDENPIGTAKQLNNCEYGMDSNIVKSPIKGRGKIILPPINVKGPQMFKDDKSRKAKINKMDIFSIINKRRSFKIQDNI